MLTDIIKYLKKEDFQFYDPELTTDMMVNIVDEEANYPAIPANIYKHIVELQKELICWIMIDLTICFANKSFYSFLNSKQQHVLGKKLHEIIPQFNLPEFSHFFQMDPDDELDVCRMHFSRPEGCELWIEWSKDYVLSDNGDILGIQIMGRDISYQIIMEEELRLSQKRYHNIVHSQSELVVCCNPDAELTFVNQAFCRFFQKSPEEILGSSLLGFIYEPDQVVIQKFIMNIGREKPEFLSPWRIIKPDGSICWQEWNTRAVFDENGYLMEFQAVGRNISERLEMEKALRESEAYYRATFESTGTAMMIYKFDMTIILVNTEFEKLSGYSREQIEYKMKWTHFIDPRDLDMMIKYHFCRQVDSDKVPNNYEFRLRDRWGNIKNIFLTVAVIPENHAVVVSFMDITERKKMEQALMQSEKRYISILNACPNEISISTIDEGRFIDANQQMCKTCERSYDEIVGHTAFELELWVNPEDRDRLVAQLIKCGSVRNQEYRVRNKSGRELITLVSAEVYEVDGKQCMILITNDITEKKQMEKEIARLDQLNLVGEMAASIGHEVRNPMTSVRGFLQLLKDNENLYYYGEYFDLMIEELDCANHIITEFLSMARHKNVDLQMRNLNSIVMTVAPLINADAVAQDKYLELQLNEVSEIMLDEKEIRQLILNLSRNGLEAMEPGNRLIIRTYTQGGKILLQVKDEGRGIARELVDKIGVPFFTTKDEGTGLGLAVCYSIAARHNASITMETGKGGTSFFVLFSYPDSK